MSLAISVRDYRGCERADIAVSRIALIAGLNGAGKSSILEAAAAALSGRPLPEGVKKKDAKHLIRRGCDAAKVTITLAGAAATATYPACDFVTTGAPIRVSPFAAGLLSVAKMSEKDRRAVLAEYLKALPTFDDLKNALTDLKFPEATIKQIWERIAVEGWDGTHGVYKDQGARRKGAWEQVTKCNFGARKAADWVPEGWEESLVMATEESLTKALAEVREELDETMRADAVSEAEFQQLKRLAAGETECERELNAVKLEEDRLRVEVAAIEKDYKALPAPPRQTENPPCPHCGSDVAVSELGGGKYKLLKPAEVDPKAAKKMAAALTAKKAELDERIRASIQASDRVRAAQSELDAARAAKTKVAQIEADQTTAGDATSGLDDLRAAVARAEARIAMFKARAEASKLWGEIARILDIVSVLAPDGLRQRKLIRAVRDFNKDQLEPISKASGWGEIRVNEDLDPEWEGRPYLMLSKSERYRVRIALQIAMARLDGSQALLIDGADILLPQARQGLFEALQTLSIPAVVACSMPDPDLVPDLAEHGLGESYWVDDGRAVALASAGTVAAAAE